MTHHLARSRRHLEHEAIKIRNMTERIKRFNNASKAIQRQDVNRQLTILKNRVIKEFEKAEMGEAMAIARSPLEGSNPPPFTARITVDTEGNVQGVYRVFNKPDTRNLTKTEFIELVQNLRQAITKDKLDLENDPSHILKRYLAEFVNPKTTR
jgi:hypothetical protein